MGGRGKLSLLRRSTARLRRPSPTHHNASSSPSSPLPSSGLSFHRKGDDDEAEMAKGKLFVPRADMDTDWQPTNGAILKLLFSLRLSAALWSGVSDCDEVYNYWEPLHLLVYGFGFQTWEYSPLYAIRSWFYVVIHSWPASILHSLLPPSKIAVFVTLRCTIALFTIFSDFCLYKAVCHRLGTSIGRFYVVLSMLSAGMFISSAAFLPSSFAMSCSSLAMAALIFDKIFLSVLGIACSSLLGWPFAALLGVPTVVKAVFVRGLPSLFILYSLLSLLIVGMPLLFVDTWYFGKRVFAPLDIIMYNIFSSHGPDLYGVEPLSYYLKNIALNWNIAGMLAPLSLPLAVLLHNLIFPASPSTFRFLRIPLSRSLFSRMECLALLYLSVVLWLLVFFSQPHKEERFLFPVYPLLAVLAAVSLDSLHRLSARFSLPSFSYWLLGLFCLISASRILSLHHNYSGAIDVYKSLNEHLADAQNELDFSVRNDPLSICVGKEWHRFPSSFFIPSIVHDKRRNKRHVRLRFLQSEFKGLLPKYFAQGKLPEITRTIPSEMNDLNQEEPSRYVPVESCDYIIDLETKHTTELEPDYGKKYGEDLRVLSSHRFLLAGESHPLARSFFIPWLSDSFCSFGHFHLLQRISPTVRTDPRNLSYFDLPPDS